MWNTVLSKHSHINTWSFLRVKRSESENYCISSSSAQTLNSHSLTTIPIFGWRHCHTYLGGCTGCVDWCCCDCNQFVKHIRRNISIGHDHLHARHHICPFNIYYNPSITVVAIFRQQSKQRRVKSESQFVGCQGLFLSLSILIYLLFVGVGVIVAPDDTQWHTHTHTHCKTSMDEGSTRRRVHF